MSENKGRIFQIKRFAVHDGPGVRTTVFFKGCPLRCRWCHNPEGLKSAPQLAYYPAKCLSCGECLICPNGAHTVGENGHIFNREKCRACGVCEKVCLGSALFFYGREVGVSDLLPELLADRAFYENSNGGVTLSGGECLCQPDFCAELLKTLKEQGIRTAVDTCGAVPRAAFDAVLPYTDLFLYDVKAADEETHRRATGQSNRRILENLAYLDERGAAIEIRVPFVPEYNDGEIGKIAALLKPLRHLTGVRVLPYHNLAGSKYEALGMRNDLPHTLPTAEQIAAAEQTFANAGLTVLH